MHAPKRYLNKGIEPVFFFDILCLSLSCSVSSSFGRRRSIIPFATLFFGVIWFFFFLGGGGGGVFVGFGQGHFICGVSCFFFRIILSLIQHARSWKLNGGHNAQSVNGFYPLGKGGRRGQEFGFFAGFSLASFFLFLIGSTDAIGIGKEREGKGRHMGGSKGTDGQHQARWEYAHTEGKYIHLFRD